MSLLDPAGREFARGLSNYAAAEATRIAGRTTDALARDGGALPPYAELIHRDNLVVVG